MLAGIKKGKKKRKVSSTESNNNDRATITAAAPTTSIRSTSSNNNQSVAEQLRKSLLAGVGSGSGAVSSQAQAKAPHHLDLLERRGRIQNAQLKDGNDNPEADNTIVITDISAGTARNPATSDVGKDWKHEALAAQSKGMSIDEEMTRNLVRRLGKRKYKMKDPSDRHYDSDEEDQRMLSAMMPEEHIKAREVRKNEEKSVQRHQAREIARHDRQNQLTKQCFWWLESPRFDRNRLIALGNHVSLVMAPLNLSLTLPHLYLVPIQHAESMVACDDEVFDELHRFQTR